jgi:hypothetical protein
VDIDSQALVPVIDELLEFVKLALDTHEKDQVNIQNLQAKLAQHEKVILEKVASAPGLDSGIARRVLSNMVSMRLISPGEDVKIASKIETDPNSVFTLLTKMAESLVAPQEGNEFHEEQSLLDADPDGWGLMAEGKPVRVKR